MTKAELLKRLEGLTESEFSKVAPYIEADLEAGSNLPDLAKAIAEGRRSRESEPLVTTEEALAAARSRLGK